MFYDLEVNLFSGDGSISRGAIKDGLKVRFYGHESPRSVVVPPVASDYFIYNDSKSSLTLRRGRTVLTIGGGKVAHIWVDGTPSGLVNVGM